MQMKPEDVTDEMRDHVAKELGVTCLCTACLDDAELSHSQIIAAAYNAVESCKPEIEHSEK